MPRALVAETRVEPRIGVGAAYVSNVLLAPPGQDTEDDWVGEIKPGITIAHDSARLKQDLDYDLQALYYADHGDYDDYFNNFLGSGVAELRTGQARNVRLPRLHAHLREDA